jgi:hypothetical protein
MNPTLVEPEMMEVGPYLDRKPRVGDVIFFRPENGDRDIVHRLTAIRPDGIRTRGDNSPREDAWLLQPSEITGRVIAAQRGKARRVIPGGRAGLVRHLFLRVWNRTNRGVSRVMRAPYRALARKGLVRACLPAGWRPRVIVFHGDTRLLVLGTRVIGRYEAGWEKWKISRPFRLIVDESALPKS